MINQKDATKQSGAADLLTLAPGVALELVQVPAGEFVMGSDPSKDATAYDNETPQHKLYLPDYWIGKYPVTVAQFAAFVKATGYQTTAEKDGRAYAYTGSEWKDIKGADWQHPRGPRSNVQHAERANHPVTLVSWNDAVAFCQWASQITGRTVRLPSEAEWEKAARGTDGRLWPWGKEPPDDKRCNFKMNVQDTTPVGQYSPLGDSPYGCTDMAGNVWEWTLSLWKAYPYNASDGREDPNSLEARVLRGGSLYNTRREARCAFRSLGDGPFLRLNNSGFRVCVLPFSL